MRVNAVLTHLCAALVAGLGTLTFLSRNGSSQIVPLAGLSLPTIALTDARGQPLDLTRSDPTVYFLVSRENCLDCSNIPVEARAVLEQYPHVRVIIIASGSDSSTVNRYFARHALDNLVTWDSAGVLVGMLHVNTPSVVFARQGKIISAYTWTPQHPNAVTILNNMRVFTQPALSAAGGCSP